MLKGIINRIKVMTEIDNYKIFNLYVMPVLDNSDLFNYISKKMRCIVFRYNFSNDKFVRKGVFGFKRLKDKYKKIEQIDLYNDFCQQFQFYLPENRKKIYVCLFNYNNNNVCVPKIYQFDHSFKTEFDPNFLLGEAEYLTVYNEEFCNEVIKQLCDFNHLLTLICNNNPGNNLFVYTINNNSNVRKHTIISLEEYVKLLKRALVPIDMINLIEDQGQIVINLQNDLNDYFLLAHLDKVKNKYQFTLMSSPGDNSLNEKTIIISL